ncbi:MAG: BrxA/BrxB family bacilliredoxin [Acidobacteriota bacterium]|nr:BrxA/BrxB family bacilliredoxin [Acidobacteriota bacterium]
MPYPEQWVTPMRQELTRIGVDELRTAEDVDQAITGEKGTVLVVVNSICGCAAARARPAIADALSSDPKPDRLTTVFAGQDLEATARAREYFFPYPPSSPSIALLSGGKLVYMMERHLIESREAYEISRDLREAFGRHCAKAETAAS